MPILLIEPLAHCADRLHRLEARHPVAGVVAAAISNTEGTVRFRSQETNSGIDTSAEGQEIESRTLESVLVTLPDFCPSLLKVAVQGFEVIILEVSVIRIGEVPDFREVDYFMEERGYRI